VIGEVITTVPTALPYRDGIVGVPFARDLRRHGARLAVITPDGAQLTYEQLADRVSDMADRLGPDRRLVLVAASNDLDPLITYLAALAGGHPVLLTEPGGAHWDTLVTSYRPDIVLGGQETGWLLRQQQARSAHSLHPDLAVLLSTSGTTGSPKLVRLSAQNIQSNAEAIAEYLDIRHTDRACAALPMHYCYGLSVINSNLVRGAGLVLTGDSVVDQRFWRGFTTHAATSLHGVPHTFELLDRVGFERMHLPSLRYVTQAGGALPPDRVRHLALLGQRRGWRFFAMYGQTEATARMAYLPPALADAHPSAVGVPIPGGRFEIAPDDLPDQGELIYRGPNVMLGYAERAEDLALGRTVYSLPTGDIGRRRADGLYEVIGRRSRLVKLFGLRIDLDQAERVLAHHGHPAACTGSDDGLIVATHSADPAAAAEATSAHLGLPASHVRVVMVDEFPRLPNGKIDYPAIQRLADTAAEAGQPSCSPGRSVREVLAGVLGRPTVADDDTFAGLGGDSLTYVQASIEIERLLGHLPARWPTMPVRQLELLARRRRPRAPRTSTVETNIVLRAIAITLIVATHIGMFHVLGGAHLLLIIAGWTFARFCLAPGGSHSGRGIVRSAARIAIPAILWLTWRVMDTTDVVASNVLLIDNYVRQGALGYWFIEVLVQTLVVLAAVFAIPPFRRWEQQHPFTFALAFLGLALLVHQLAEDTNAFAERSMATHGVLWLFALGWLAQRSAHRAAKAMVLAVALLTVPGYFGSAPRETVILLGLALLVCVPHLRLPRPVVLVAGTVASASLYIYLTHYAVYHLTLPHLPALAVLPICLAAGIVTWYTAHRLERGIGAMSRALRRVRLSRTAPAHLADSMADSTASAREHVGSRQAGGALA
jgi:acyl-coenzyme A synthetase/AMP-(fatty) acid ligase